MALINKIEIQNFKSIRHQLIDGCKRINLFLGYPNVGKSNIMEAIGLFSCLLQNQGERFSFDQICRSRHISDLHFDRNLRNKVTITINDLFELKILNRNPLSILEIIINSKKDLINTFKTNIGEKGNFQSYTMENFSEFSQLNKIKYYIFDKHSEYNKKKTDSLSVPGGDNLLDILLGNSELRKAYTELLKLYNLKLSLSETEILVAKDLIDGTYVSFSHFLVSDTLKRLFFYKAAIETNRESVLIFEEPEAHMFPPYISKFTAEVMFDKSGNQYFISTHSPFVINDFMENLKDDLNVYVVDYKKETGESVIKRLEKPQLDKIYQYGTDILLNLENFLG